MSTRTVSNADESSRREPVGAARVAFDGAEGRDRELAGGIDTDKPELEVLAGPGWQGGSVQLNGLGRIGAEDGGVDGDREAFVDETFLPIKLGITDDLEGGAVVPACGDDEAPMTTTTAAAAAAKKAVPRRNRLVISTTLFVEDSPDSSPMVSEGESANTAASMSFQRLSGGAANSRSSAVIERRRAPMRASFRQVGDCRQSCWFSRWRRIRQGHDGCRS